MVTTYSLAEKLNSHAVVSLPSPSGKSTFAMGTDSHRK